MDVSDPSIFQSIIYTTKLDNMKIFNSNVDLSDTEFKSLAHAVETESKPKFVSKRKLESNFENGGKENISYETLKKKVKIANKKGKDIRRRNDKLLALCKPFSIVLIDLKHLPNQTNQQYQKVELSREELRKRFGPYLQEIDDNEYKSCSNTVNDDVVFVSSYAIATNQTKKSKNPKDKKHYQHQNKLFIIYDQQSQLKYFYLVASRGIVTEYRIFDAVKDKVALSHRIEIAMYDTTLEKVKVRSCCWYDRVKKIELIKHCNKQTKRFMNIPHGCDPFECKCCCNRNKLVRIVDQSDYYRKSSSIKELINEWLPIILRVPVPLSPYLLPKPVISAISSNKSQTNSNDRMFLKSTTIRIENNFYTLGDNGHIKSYIKDDENAVANITAKICCWFSRKQFVDRLIAFAALPDVINFLKAPHECAFDACVCCCKPAKRKKEKLLFYAISPRHTGECSKKKLNMKIKFAKQTSHETTQINPNATVPQSVPPLAIPSQMFKMVPVTVPTTPLIPSSPATISTPIPLNLASFPRAPLPASFLQTLSSPVNLPSTSIPAVVPLRPLRPLTVPPPLQPIQSGGSITLCPLSSARQIETKAVLEKLKNVRFIFKPGKLVSVDLGVPLKQLGLLELKVLERVLESFDNLRKTHKSGSSKQNEDVPPQAREPQSLLDLYAQMSSIHSRKSRQCIKSYRDFMRKSAAIDSFAKSALNNAKKPETIPNNSSESTSTLNEIVSDPSKEGDIEAGTNKPGSFGKLRIKTPNEISHSVIID